MFKHVGNIWIASDCQPKFRLYFCDLHWQRRFYAYATIVCDVITIEIITEKRVLQTETKIFTLCILKYNTKVLKQKNDSVIVK